MSIIVYGVFDSTDAAELTALRLKRNVAGVNVAGISKRVLPDESEELTIYAFPVYNAGIGGISTGYGSTPVPYMDYVTDSMRDQYIEPARREDVSLRAEAADSRTAQMTASLMRSMGGREIRQMER